MFNRYSFWGNVDYGTNDEAKQARDTKARELVASGQKIRKERIANQMRKYSGFGQYDGRIGHVYVVHVIA